MSVLDGNIQMSALLNDPNISVEIGREIEDMSWDDSKWHPIVGRGENRGVRVFSAETKDPYRPRLKAALSGAGVRGEADFATNFDKIEIYSQTITPQIIGNAVPSGNKQYEKMKHIDFVREAKDSLTNWIRVARDKLFCTALFNDLTDCVVADATDGYKDVSTCLDVKAAAKKIVKGDVLTVATLKQAIKQAKMGVIYNGKARYPMRPVKCTTAPNPKDISVVYQNFVILLDTYQIYQILQDPEWKDMQKYAPKSETNRIFTGLVGMVDGCPVLDMGVWGQDQAGLVNSETPNSEYKDFIIADNLVNGKITYPSQYANAQPTSFGYLIGASALLMAGTTQPAFWIEEYDMGRKVRVGIDRLMGIAKAKFKPNESSALDRFAGTDFSVIGIISSKE
jgi:hypothetical protein